jgi:hypothetical protein
MSQPTLSKIKEWLTAWRKDKRWPLCSWCHIRLLWADDIGFMYLHPFPAYDVLNRPLYDKRNDRPCCRHCYYGLPGTVHTNRHGVGER